MFNILRAFNALGVFNSGPIVVGDGGPGPDPDPEPTGPPLLLCLYGFQEMD